MEPKGGQNNLPQVNDRNFDLLLQTKKWCDVQLKVGDAPDQRLISAHKLILAAASPVFEAMLFENVKEGDAAIEIPGVKPDAFQALLEYIYSDRINISSFDQACDLYALGKEYHLPYVVEQCTRFLQENLSAQNACRTYEFARLNDESRLKQKSLAFIATNTLTIIRDPGFLDIDLSTLMVILDQNELAISEWELFNGLQKFANKRGLFMGRPSMTPQDDNAKAAANKPPINDFMAVVEKNQQPDVSAEVNNGRDNVEILESATGSSANTVTERASSSSIASNIDVSDAMDDLPLTADEEALREAVKKIRFLSLTPEEFADGPAYSKLLRQNEIFLLCMNISCPNIAGYPMPKGFSTSRIGRGDGQIMHISPTTPDDEEPNLL